jgi:hypothetical protein
MFVFVYLSSVFRRNTIIQLFGDPERSIHYSHHVIGPVYSQSEPSNNSGHHMPCSDRSQSEHSDNSYVYRGASPLQNSPSEHSNSYIHLVIGTDHSQSEPAAGPAILTTFSPLPTPRRAVMEAALPCSSPRGKLKSTPNKIFNFHQKCKITKVA